MFVYLIYFEETVFHISLQDATTKTFQKSKIRIKAFMLIQGGASDQLTVILMVTTTQYLKKSNLY